jgi:hypothetical protein
MTQGGEFQSVMEEKDSLGELYENTKKEIARKMNRADPE